MNRKFRNYISGANWLTKRERFFLFWIIALLLTGWAVKWHRAARPPQASVQQSEKHASSQF